MVSEFRQKKFLYLFKIMFNADRNSTIDKKDFEASLENISKVRGLDKDGETYKVLLGLEEKIWQGLSKNKDKINANDWISLWDAPHGVLHDFQNLHCKVAFIIQDTSGDGVVDEEEFMRVHEAFGIPQEVIKQSFQKMSKGNPSISWEEFQNLYKEFLLSEDIDAPGNYIFGSNTFFK